LKRKVFALNLRRMPRWKIIVPEDILAAGIRDTQNDHPVRSAETS
jgi:hypothetical protein